MTGATTLIRVRLAPIALSLIGGLVCGVLAWWGHRHTHLALIIVESLLVPVPILIRAYQRKWDPFEPINFMVIGIVVLFVARPIAELSMNLNPYPQYNARLGFDQAMLIGIVGTAMLYLGYFWRAGGVVANSIRPLPDSWDAARSVRFAVRLLILGAFLALGYAAQIGAHNFLNLYTGRAATQHALQRAASAYFEQGPYLTIPASFILLVAYLRRRTLGTALLLAFSIGLALLVTVPRGDRTFILELTLPLLVLFYLRRHRRPRVVMILVAFVVLVLVANIEVALRNKETRHGQNASQTIVGALTHPGHELTKFIAGADPSEFSVLAIEAHALKTGLLTYQPGSTVRNIAIGWIPHQIYGNKPLTPLQYVSWTLFPQTFGAGSYGPPMFGSMYADYGWLTLVVYSLAVGVGLRAVWEYFRPRLHVGGMQLVFAGMLPLVIILLRDDIDDIFYRSVFLVIPLIFCVRACSRPPRSIRARLGGRRATRSSFPAIES